MKRILTASVFLLFISSCSTDNKYEVELDLVPVKSGEYWGYIDHEGKFKINPQFKMGYVFNEGLALVQSSDRKYGFINKEGKYVVNPTFLSALGFSEGLALAVRESSKLEFINKEGEQEFVLPAEIEKAYRFTEGLALVYSDGLYGYINKKGKMEIPFKFKGARKFCDGMAQVYMYDSVDRKLKYGFINKKGELVINYQFNRASDFSEGLALVNNGSQYGYIDKDGKYVINPQFEFASDFIGEYAIIKLGELYGYIDKKGKIIINPQFKQADNFFENSKAAVLSNDGKYGFIDKEGNFSVEPQFDLVSRYYSGISFVRMGNKFGLIDMEGKIVVNPQFDSYLTIKDDDNFVHSDYFDLDGTISYLLNGTTSNAIYNFTSGMSFKNVQEKYPGFNVSNYYSFTGFGSAGENKNARLSNMSFDFRDLYHYKENYSTTQVYNPVAGGYEEQKVYNGTTSTLNENALINSVRLQYALKSKAPFKKKEIMNGLVNRLVALGFKLVSQENDQNLSTLENDGMSIQIGYDSGGKDTSVVMYVTFKGHEFMDGYLATPDTMQISNS